MTRSSRSLIRTEYKIPPCQGRDFLRFQSCRRGGALPRPAGCKNKFAQQTATTQNVRRGRCPHRPGRMQLQNCTMFGEIAKRFVGADDPVRPWGNGKFAATFRKNGRASYGSMRRPQASFEAQPRAARLLAPKMGIDPYKRCAGLHRCIRVCRCVPPGGQRRPPLQDVVRFRRWCVQFCDCVLPGRARHRPLRTGCVFDVCCTILRVHSAREGQCPAPTLRRKTHTHKKPRRKFSGGES